VLKSPALFSCTQDIPWLVGCINSGRLGCDETSERGGDTFSRLTISASLLATGRAIMKQG